MPPPVGYFPSPVLYPMYQLAGALSASGRPLRPFLVAGFGGNHHRLRPCLDANPHSPPQAVPASVCPSRSAHVPSPRVFPPVSTCLSIPHPIPWPVPPNLLARLPLALGGPDRQLHSCSTTLRDGVSTGLSLHHQFCRLSIVLSTH